MDGFDGLLARARAGDAAALEALLGEHLPAIAAIVRLKAGPGLLRRESVSDLQQSVCREVLESLDGFRDGGADGFRRWLHTLALRKLYDRQRRVLAQQRDVRREVAVDESPSAWDAVCHAFDTPSREAIGREAKARLDAAFAQLDDEQQDIVTWSRFLGLSHKEIAERLGKTEVATRKALSRALLRLSDALE
ncbi:MAG: sigma-70 family RNA polymerase sigma factor [Planctomycetes bacterium]|nr:sigma-70 family RNA polymerase sigma factor [Planctomycetota bacterium]